MRVSNIKEIREKYNLSAEFVAIHLDITTNEYEKIEKGLINVKLSKLDRIIKIIGAQQGEINFINFS